MKENISSNKIVFYNMLSTVLLYIVSFFSAPIFSRILGTENFGIVQIYNTWLSVFTIVCGLESRGTLMIAKAHMDEKEYEKYCASIMSMTLAVASVILIIVFIFRGALGKIIGLEPQYVLLLCVHCFANHCVTFINAKFTYEMKARNNMLLSVTLAVSTFGLSYLLIMFLPCDNIYAGRLLGYAIPYIIASIIVVIYVYNKGRTLFNKKYWGYCLSLAIPLIFHGIGGLVCESSDRIMIQKMLTLSAVGVYSLAYSFANIMDSIRGAFNNSWNPFFVDFLRQNKLDVIKARAKNYIRVFSCLMVGFILLTPEVYHLFASKDYWEGAFVIPIVTLYIFTQFIYLFGVNYEFYMERTDVVAVGTFVTGICNLIFNYIFISLYGYIGAAIATLLSGIVSASIHIILGKKLAADRWVYELNMFIFPTMCIAFSVILFFVCFDLWIIRWFIALVDGVYLMYKLKKTRTIF